MADKYPETVKLVVKHFPLPSHSFARQAATAALAAAEQGKFWEFHAKLFENYRSLNEAKVQKIAEELALDPARFENDRKSPDIQALITRDIQDGKKIGVRGTPTIFINGKMMKRRSLADFERAIQAELKMHKK